MINEEGKHRVVLKVMGVKQQVANGKVMYLVDTTEGQFASFDAPIQDYVGVKDTFEIFVKKKVSGGREYINRYINAPKGGKPHKSEDVCAPDSEKHQPQSQPQHDNDKTLGVVMSYAKDLVVAWVTSNPKAAEGNSPEDLANLTDTAFRILIRAMEIARTGKDPDKSAVPEPSEDDLPF